MAIIETRGLSYSYDDERPVLKKINFAFTEGSINAVLGLSGCGKSTLCYALCGIIPQVYGGSLEGKILYRGEDIANYPLSKLSQQIGLVMQDPDEAMVTTTVEDELAFAPENLCLEPAEIRDRVESVLELLGLTSLRLANPNQLSCGQKQLVAIGAVLTLAPQVLVLDEPISHLDQTGRAMVKQVLLDLQKQGRTIIFSEHDTGEASFADHWLIMQDGILVGDDTAANILRDSSFLMKQNLL